MSDAFFENLWLGLASGLVSGIVTSFVWLLILRRLRPRVAISPQLAWDGKWTWVKLVNRSRRALVDLQLNVDVLRSRTGKGGVWTQRHAVKSVGTVPVIIPGWARHIDDDNTYRFAFDLDPKTVFDSSGSFRLRFRLLVRDEVPSVGRVIERVYASDSVVVSGEFKKGQGFSVV